MIQVIKNENEWNQAINSADSADFYHTYHYHHLSKKTNEEPLLLKYCYNDKVLLLPLLVREITNTRFKDATSVYGYAGVLTVNGNRNFDCSHFSEELETFLKSQNIVSVFSRLHPFIDHQETILSQLGGVSSIGNVVYIDLSESLEYQKKNYSRRLKTHLNKARRYCIVESGQSDSDLDEFIEIYYKNMRRVNAKSFYFFSKNYFKELFNDKQFITELLICRLKENNKAIAAGLFIKYNGIVQYHLSGMDENYVDYNPIKLLIDHVRITATNQGYKYFNLGGGRASKGDSLLYFKNQFSKSMAPFSVWKYIVDKDIYLELEKQGKKLGIEQVRQEDSNYFPSYRCS